MHVYSRLKHQQPDNSTKWLRPYVLSSVRSIG